MTGHHKDIYVGTLKALAEFISTNHLIPYPSDEGCRRINAGDALYSLPELWSREAKRTETDEIWKLKAFTLELFLRKAPALLEMMRPIAFGVLNISRESPYDPLTFWGVSDLTHFIDNGLVDDWWLALYQANGERRIVHEAADDDVQFKKPFDKRYAKRIDKPESWFQTAQRNVLCFNNFEGLFAEDLRDINPSVPTQDELMELWLARPYDDFAPALKP